jgi:hypothetical protein
MVTRSRREATTAAITRNAKRRARAKRHAIGFFAALAVLFAMGATAAADAPPGPYFNGFETDTAGWFDNSGGTITRVPSGDTSTMYASGVAAATGNYYARLGKDTDPDSCTFGGRRSSPGAAPSRPAPGEWKTGGPWR